MGRIKQLLQLEGAPILQHAIDAACASQLFEIVIVLGYGADEICAAVDFGRARVARCADWNDGPRASLAAGLSALSEEAGAAAVLLGDQPGVDVALIDRALSAWRGVAEPALRMLFEDPSGERISGHPVVLAREVWAEVIASRRAHDDGARAWLGANADRVFELCVNEPAPCDVDTWQDYRRLVETPRANET